MDDEKLEDSITNIELALHHIRAHRQKNPSAKVDLEYPESLLLETLEILRNFEVRVEIDKYSGEE